MKCWEGQVLVITHSSIVKRRK